MPQLFQVLCCYSCEIFQVHFMKKSNKWQCKVCNKKQSLKKAFKIGSAPECRSLVQQLNLQRGCQKQDVNTEEEETNDTATEERQVPNPNEFNDLEHVDHSWYKRSEDEMWSENDDFSSNSFFPDNLSEVCCENPTNESNLLAEDIKLFKTSELKSQQNDVISSPIEDVKQAKPSFCENIQNCDGQRKRLYVPCSNSSSSTNAPPPFKKNRGFEFIKSAASKLG